MNYRITKLSNGNLKWQLKYDIKYDLYKISPKNKKPQTIKFWTFEVFKIFIKKPKNLGLFRSHFPALYEPDIVTFRGGDFSCILNLGGPDGQSSFSFPCGLPQSPRGLGRAHSPAAKHFDANYAAKQFYKQIHIDCYNVLLIMFYHVGPIEISLHALQSSAAVGTIDTMDNGY